MVHLVQENGTRKLLVTSLICQSAAIRWHGMFWEEKHNSLRDKLISTNGSQTELIQDKEQV